MQSRYVQNYWHDEYGPVHDSALTTLDSYVRPFSMTTYFLHLDFFLDRAHDRRNAHCPGPVLFCSILRNTSILKSMGPFLRSPVLFLAFTPFLTLERREAS